MFELLCLAEENRKLFSGGKNAVFKKERVHCGPMDVTAGANGQFSFGKSILSVFMICGVCTCLLSCILHQNLAL